MGSDEGNRLPLISRDTPVSRRGWDNETYEGTMSGVHGEIRMEKRRISNQENDDDDDEEFEAR